MRRCDGAVEFWSDAWQGQGGRGQGVGGCVKCKQLYRYLYFKYCSSGLCLVLLCNTSCVVGRDTMFLVFNKCDELRGQDVKSVFSVPGGMVNARYNALLQCTFSCYHIQ